MTEVLVQIVVMGLACSTLSVTIARTDMFRWLRLRVARWGILVKLFTCHWCLGHWFALVAVALVNPWPTVEGFVMTWLAVTAVSGIAATKILGE